MAADLNAIGLIIVLLLTGYVLNRYSRWSWNIWRGVRGVVYTTVLLKIAHSLSSHLCLSGDPLPQWLLPLLCFGFVYIFVEGKKVRVVLSVILIFSAFFLEFHYHYIVHNLDFTGDPKLESRIGNSWKIFPDRTYKAYDTWIKEILMQELPVSREFPEGWVKENEIFLALIPEEAKPFVQHDDLKARILWHTWLTGLYGIDHTPQAMWFPGGTRDNADIITYRIKRL